MYASLSCTEKAAVTCVTVDTQGDMAVSVIIAIALSLKCITSKIKSQKIIF